MRLRKGLAVVAAVAALALVGAACQATATPTPENEVEPTSEATGASGQIPPESQIVSRVVGSSGSAAVSGARSPSVEMVSSYPGSYQPAAGATGIHVTGSGLITATPDLATLNLGVEARADTVEQARSQAAEAMNAVMDELSGLGVAEEDIQTSYFSIQPEYVWQEVTERETGVRRGEQVLVGYRVTNTVTVDVHDLAKTGEIIDAVAKAGGDLIRINNVRFTLENRAQYEAEVRRLAVEDARNKAAQMAGWAGESLGKLVYLAEVSMSSPVVYQGIERAAVADEGMAPTPISPGELQVQVQVQGVWGIK